MSRILIIILIIIIIKKIKQKKIESDRWYTTKKENSTVRHIIPAEMTAGDGSDKEITRNVQYEEMSIELVKTENKKIFSVNVKLHVKTLTIDMEFVFTGLGYYEKGVYSVMLSGVNNRPAQNSQGNYIKFKENVEFSLTKEGVINKMKISGHGENNTEDKQIELSFIEFFEDIKLI